MEKTDHLLSGCLYFASNKFARALTKLAEEEFKITQLSPTYAFALTIVNKYNSISATELAKYLHMAPSTITRFVDKLVSKDLLKRRIEGKNSFVYSTKKGKELQVTIDKAWMNLYNSYSKKIGYEKGKKITTLLNEVLENLE